MSYIDHINLVDGMNISPIPLEAGNSMTTTKWLMAIQDKINKIIDLGNQWEQKANQYTDDKTTVIQKEIDELMRMVKTGEIIKDGTITAEKLEPNFLNDFQDIILQAIHDATKFVTFGLQGDYFCAWIPTTWNEVTFSTDSEGHLCLEM